MAIRKSCRTFAGSISTPMQREASIWKGHKRRLAARTTAISDSRDSRRSRTTHLRPFWSSASLRTTNVLTSPRLRGEVEAVAQRRLRVRGSLRKRKSRDLHQPRVPPPEIAVANFDLSPQAGRGEVNVTAPPRVVALVVRRGLLIRDAVDRAFVGPCGWAGHRLD